MEPNTTPAPANGKVKGIIALVLGIVAIALAFFGYWSCSIIAIVAGIVGLILAVSARKEAAAVGAPSGLATAGLVLSIIGLVLAVIFIFVCTIPSTAARKLLGGSLKELNDLAKLLS